MDSNDLSFGSELVHTVFLKLIHTATPDSTQTGLYCRVWCGGVTSRLDRHTGAFCVWSVSECVGRRSATAGRTPTQNALVGPTEFTPPDTTERTVSSCVAGGVNWALLSVS